MSDFEKVSQYVQDFEAGFSGLDLFRKCFENTTLLSDEEADILDRFIERAGGFVDGAQAVLFKIKELKNKESKQ